MAARHPLRRKDCFFGLHFDLHPRSNDTELGRDLTEDMARRLLEEVRPDFVQYDCKGHPGYAGYPTKVGWPSPGIVKDSLAIWRKITREQGIGLYVHYSGVWDSVAVEKHPEWARLDNDGNPDRDLTSTFGPYCEELLIPQLKEAIDAYDLDGVWVDGDCWAVKPDYCPGALEALRSLGFGKAPMGKGDPGWKEFLDLQRKAFRDYVGRYCDALHGCKQDFQITSNWMYSTLAPEPVSLPLDYLSGDYSPTDSVNRARLEARYLASTGMPWDLMAWGFNKAPETGHAPKTPEQLKQEASVVLAQGGGFQIYYNPTRGGWIDDWMIRIMSDVARFCRERKDFSHRTRSVPQLALILPTESIFDRADRVYGPWPGDTAPVEGLLNALLELHYSVDVLAEHQITGRLSDYDMVALPESHLLPEGFREEIESYARAGGHLLVVGAETVGMFRDLLGVELGPVEELPILVEGGPSLAWMGGQWQRVEAEEAESIGFGYLSADTRKDSLVTASRRSLGKGQVCAIYGPFGTVFRRTHSAVARRYLHDVMRAIQPPLGLAAPPCVDVALRRTGEDLLVHLANTANMQTAPDHTTIDFIPPAGPIALEIRSRCEPYEITVEPGHREPIWDRRGDELQIFLDSLELHSVVAVRGHFAPAG